MSSDTTKPTFVGFVACAADAAAVFEASMQGYLPRVAHRPPPHCHRDIAKSGHIFVFGEIESGIKRWTDGLRWSPSRTRDGFMFYRELDEQQIEGRSGRKALSSDQRSASSTAISESQLYGSLIDSYRFSKNGLMKKTISVRLGESIWRLVSYYQVGDVTTGSLQRPSEDQRLWFVQPNEDLRRAMQCWDAPQHTEMAVNGHLGHFSSIYESALIFDHRHEGMNGHAADEGEHFELQGGWIHT